MSRQWLHRAGLLAAITLAFVVLLGDGSLARAIVVHAQQDTPSDTPSDRSPTPDADPTPVASSRLPSHPCVPPAATTSIASPRAEFAPSDPRLFDLDLAINELDALDREISGRQLEIADLIEGIDGLKFERDFLDLNRPARGDVLDAARADARRLAVATYVGMEPLTGLDLLNAETAGELSWNSALLRQQTERLHTVAETYALLAGEADSDVLVLSDEINNETRRLEALNRQLANTQNKVPAAECYISIAQIHATADSEFIERARREPSDEQWRALRRCESTETYNIDNGNTFYGAYQFTWDTWGTVGGSGNPALAPAAEQDARARLLYSRRGDQPWPICGKRLRPPGG
ncbi:MAG: transglycosylase family protein [Actinomycetota bacterium]